jgi:hypothetical protein
MNTVGTVKPWDRTIPTFDHAVEGVRQANMQAIEIRIKKLRADRAEHLKAIDAIEHQITVAEEQLVSL